MRLAQMGSSKKRSVSEIKAVCVELGIPVPSVHVPANARANEWKGNTYGTVPGVKNWDGVVAEIGGKKQLFVALDVKPDGKCRLEPVTSDFFIFHHFAQHFLPRRDIDEVRQVMAHYHSIMNPE